MSRFLQFDWSRQTVPFYPKWDSFCIFTQSPYWKLSNLCPKLDSSGKLKDNSCADNTGSTDCYIIKIIIDLITLNVTICYIMWLNPKQIDMNNNNLLDLWARSSFDQNNLQLTKGPEMKSKLVTYNMKGKVSNNAFWKFRSQNFKSSTISGSAVRKRDWLPSFTGLF